MLRLTRQADYGLVLLTHVASRPEGTVHASRQIAEEVHLPLPMVGKVLKALAKAGLLESHRGVKGGYSLARPAREVTVAQIIHALEGPIAMTECLSPAAADCEQEPWCPTRRPWRLINEAVNSVLESVTLADMAEPEVPARVLVDLQVATGARVAGGDS